VISRREIIASAALLPFAARALPAAAQASPLRVGVVAADTYAEANFADQAGIFERNRLPVEVTVLANAGTVGAAVASGALDIGCGSVGQIAAARENGIPFYLIAPGALFNAKAPPAELRVATSSTLQMARELNGKSVGIDNLGGLPQISVNAWVQKNGGDASSLKFLEIPFPAMAAALQAGRVDAAVIAEPSLSAARNNTRLLANTLEAIAPSFFISVWFAAKPWLSQNTAIAHRFADVIGQSARWANAHHDQSAAMLVALTKVTREQAAIMNRAYFGNRLEARLLDPILALTPRYGITNTVVPGASLIYDGFAS
jgi:NitT/TauT family transport system substrate-binding protein